MDVSKHRQVHNWLAGFFGPNGIPKYEICERTTDVLHSMMEHCQEQDEDLKMLIDDAKLKCIQYETEARRLEDVLNDLAMTPNLLPQDAYGKLQALVDVTQHLDVNKVDIASLSIRMFELLKESAWTKHYVNKTEFEVDKLAKKVASISRVSEQLQKSLVHALNYVQIEKEKSGSYEKTVDVLKQQKLQYEEKNKQYETILSTNGFSSSLTHEELQKKNEQLKAIQEEFNVLKEKLDSYHDLPTDLNLLAKKVSEAKTQLNHLEETVFKVSSCKLSE